MRHTRLVAVAFVVSVPLLATVLFSAGAVVAEDAAVRGRLSRRRRVGSARTRTERPKTSASVWAEAVDLLHRCRSQQVYVERVVRGAHIGFERILHGAAPFSRLDHLEESLVVLQASVDDMAQAAVRVAAHRVSSVLESRAHPAVPKAQLDHEFDSDVTPTLQDVALCISSMRTYVAGSRWGFRGKSFDDRRAVDSSLGLGDEPTIDEISPSSETIVSEEYRQRVNDVLLQERPEELYLSANGVDKDVPGAFLADDEEDAGGEEDDTYDGV